MYGSESNNIVDEELQTKIESNSKAYYNTHTNLCFMKPRASQDEQNSAEKTVIGLGKCEARGVSCFCSGLFLPHSALNDL